MARPLLSLVGVQIVRDVRCTKVESARDVDGRLHAGDRELALVGVAGDGSDR